MECPECGKNFYGMQMMIQNVSVIFAASLICDFCPSDRSFAYSFLQIPSHDGHPYCSAIHFPLSGHVRDLHPLERAHGAQTKSGAAHAAPPIPYGYSIARICSIRDCFFCLRIVHTDKISSIPNNTRMNNPISKTGNL